MIDWDKPIRTKCGKSAELVYTYSDERQNGGVICEFIAKAHAHLVIPRTNHERPHDI